jgi:putative membrane protein insertion efficiency factor
MRRFIRILIRSYQLTLSPLLQAVGGPGSGCRFEPSCSHYFLLAVETHGPWRGSWLGLKRIGRCHPWGGSGHDPVPTACPRVAFQERVDRCA